MFRTFHRAPSQVSSRSFDDIAAAAHLHIGMAAAVVGIAAFVGVLYLACAGDTRLSLVGTWPPSTGIVGKAVAACSLPCDQRRR
jgi:hypothetical protein